MGMNLAIMALRKRPLRGNIAMIFKECILAPRHSWHSSHTHPWVWWDEVIRVFFQAINEVVYH